MRPSIALVVALSFLFPSACSDEDRNRPVRSRAAIESVRTDLRRGSCREEVDRSDPNETPYLVCPGVAGYSLIVRHVDAGRLSIDVVDAARHVRPLDYQEFITRHMSTLGDEAEWRVATQHAERIPIALIVRVQAREDPDNPERVTGSYLAVAKITSNEACVTDRIREGARSDAQARSAADSAHERPCAPPQPPLTSDGAVTR